DVTVDLLAESGIAERAAMHALLGDGLLRAADIHRLVETHMADPDLLAARLAQLCAVRLLDSEAVRDCQPSLAGLSLRFLTENWLVPLTGPDGEALIGALHPGDM